MIADLKKGDLITMLYVNSGAMTSRQRVIFERLSDDGLWIVYKPGPRKRKLFKLKIEVATCIFLGHEQPFEIESDAGTFMINACMNLVSDKPIEVIRQWIEDNNIQPSISEHDKAHMMLTTREQSNNTENELTIENCLYPNTKESSSLVNGIRSKGIVAKVSERVKTFQELEDIISYPRNGANNFFQHPLKRNFIYTDGVKEYMDKAGAYWLSDALAQEFVSVIASRDPDTYYLSVEVYSRSIDAMNRAIIQLKDYTGEILKTYLIATDHIEGGKLKFPFAYDGEHVTWCLHSEN